MKRFTSIFLGLFLTLMCQAVAAFAQTPDEEPCQEYSEAEITLLFDLGSARINPTLGGNRHALMEMDSLLTAVNNDSSWVVKKVSVRGSASPDGPVELNRRLSRNRADAISRHFAQYTDDASVPTDFHYAGANWDGLRELVVAESGMPARDVVIRIIDSGSSNRMAQIKRLNSGVPYRLIRDKMLPQLRTSTVTLSLHRECAPKVIIERQTNVVEDIIEEYAEPDTLLVAEVDEVEEEIVAIENPEYIRNLYVKTNAIGWVMAIPNIAFEVDIVPHLSLTLPLYYSAWNYGSHKVKFRTCAFEPELRAWTRADNTGFFAGAHFGVAQYNVAWGGKYRYQDHNGHTPALGGGVSIGYRCHLGSKRNWMMEFTVGGGAYRLHYDVFDNSSVPYGYKVDECHKTFFGVDNVGVTFIYVVPLHRKGGVR